MLLFGALFARYDWTYMCMCVLVRLSFILSLIKNGLKRHSFRVQCGTSWCIECTQSILILYRRETCDFHIELANGAHGYSRHTHTASHINRKSHHWLWPSAPRIHCLSFDQLIFYYLSCVCVFFVLCCRSIQFWDNIIYGLVSLK